jgi:hypothetical protein
LALTSLDKSGNKIDTPDVTDMLTTGIARVFLPGLENSGEVSLKYNVKPGDAAQAGYIATKGVATDFKLMDGLGNSAAFSGINTGIDYSFPDDKPVTASSKIQISGPVVWTAAS